MARWVFVRHGQSVANRDGWLAGWLDVPLTAEGRLQAVRAADALTHRVERVVSSDLRRARETATAFTRRLGLPLSETPALRERAMGDWAGRDRAALRRTDAWQAVLGWDTAPPGGESQRDLAHRVLTWLAGARDVDTLVVAHGGVLRVVRGLLDGVPRGEIGLKRVENTQIIVREATPGTWRDLLRDVE